MFHAVTQPLRAAQRFGRNSLETARTLITGKSAVTGTAPQSFVRNEDGNIAIIFALTAAVSCFMVGGAVDIGRAYSVRTKMQNALDAASLAAASAYINDPAHNETNALAIATKFFNASMTGVTGATMTTSPINASTQTVRLTAQASVQTPFLKAASAVTLVASTFDFSSITMTATSVTSATQSQTGGSNDVEMVMMLDTTGSMGWDSGDGTSKISALRTAATNFVNILIPDAGVPHVKIGIVPFAPQVAVSDSLAQTLTGQPLTKTVTLASTCGSYNTTCAAYRNNGSCRTWNTLPNTCTGYLSRCMIDRSGTEAQTETSPLSGGTAFLPAQWASDLATATTCTPSQQVMPLTTSKSTLTGMISTLTANGSTAGALGTAWAWYMLSPTWNQNSIFTGSQAPVAYNTPKLKKIAVLMTDGEYNCAASDVNGNCTNTDTAANNLRAVALCNGMKAKGIEVYTIGFKLDVQVAIDTLSSCATDADHFFQATDAAALDAAFKAIAYRSVPLHVME